MSKLTRTPISMLDSRGEPNSDVRFNGDEVVAVPDEDINNTGIASANYDSSTGTLTLNLVNGQKLVIDGFMTQGSIGVGPAGSQGIAGTDGTDGLLGTDGQQGPQGCQGPPGRPGATGPRGAMGPQGPQGDIGPTGPKGDPGADGKVDVYIQTEDPGAVGAGALWIRP